MEGQAAPGDRQQPWSRQADPAPTGQFVLAEFTTPGVPAPTQVLSLPPVRGRSRRASAGRIALVVSTVIGLVLGAVSLVGGPAALAGDERRGTLSSERALTDPASTDPAPAIPASTDPAPTDEGAPSREAGSDPIVDGAIADALDGIASDVDIEEPAELLDDIAAEIGASDDRAPDRTATEGTAAATPGVVYLTFDDGPHPKHTPAVLEVLARHGATGTFFVLGSLAETHPQLIDRIVAEGHTVANHSWAHQDLAQMNRQQFNESVGRTQAALGEHATACLRPPYGSMNANTHEWAADLGLDVILWDTDTLDWQKPGVDAVADVIVEGASHGPNILLHDGGGDRTESVLALDQALTELAEQGFSFEPICR